MAVKLPSPEEYGKHLAEKRRRASGVPEILASLAKTTQGIEKALQDALADVARQTAEQQKASNEESRQALGEAIEAVPLPFVLDRLEALMGAVESLASQIYRQGDAIMQAMMPLDRPPVDLSAVEAKLAAIERRVEERNEVQVVEAPAPAAFPAPELKLRVVGRDGNNDISDIAVEVIKH